MLRWYCKIWAPFTPKGALQIHILVKVKMIKKSPVQLIAPSIREEIVGKSRKGKKDAGSSVHPMPKAEVHHSMGSVHGDKAF